MYRGNLKMNIFSKAIDKRLQEYQTELLSTHYEEVENMYKKIRGWRHDYRNHIQILKNYAENGDLEQIKLYLDELDADLNTVDLAFKSGNKVTDAILNSKIALAKSKDITIECDANVPMELTVSEIDLCIIMGNLLDNAIEASMSLPQDERLIRIYIDIKGKQLYISVTNLTSTKKQKKIGNIFKTTKGNGHGFGLVRIDDIIKRYNGYISRNSESGVFSTEILLPL